MIFKKKTIILSVLFLALLVPSIALGQTSEQKALESKRSQLQKEINDINRLLFAGKKEKGSVLNQMEALDKKINVREQLIRVTNQQSNLLNRQINVNVKNISKLKASLKLLREDYALMIEKSYQNRSEQSRLMFLLSSDNFFQAFKRLQYMKQYTAYRKEQGEQILSNTDDLARLNKNLNEERKVKDVLISQNRKAKNQLFKEISTQKELLVGIRKNESKYTSEIRQKQKQARKLDRQIDNLIKSAIAASNKKTNKNSRNSSKFVLTPEAALVATNFTANKGKLIWPVEKGIKSQGFGIYSDAVYPGIKHQSNGVILATDKGAKARAIFQGEVIAILSVPGGKKGVQIKHGNFISTYYNLSQVYVKKGEMIAAKKELGAIYTNQNNGQTLLKFYLYKDTSRLNPEEWVFQL